jgi:hypothetical protein
VDVSTASTYFDATPQRLFLASTSNGQNTGLRFQGITVPKNANICSANLTFKAAQAGTAIGTVGFTVKGINQDSAPAFTSNADYNGRPVTTQSTPFTPSAWNLNSFYSVDIKTIVQAIVNRTNWVSGNAMAFKITSNNTAGDLKAYAFENTDANKVVAQLNVTYENAGTSCGGTPPTSGLYTPPDITLSNFNAIPLPFPALAKPGYSGTNPVSQAVNENVFTGNLAGNKIVRVSDSTFFSTSPNRPNGFNFNELRHLHATNQAWNSNASRIMLNKNVWTPILDGTTYQLLKWLRTPEQSFWSATNPDIIYGLNDIDGSGSTTRTRLVSINAQSAASGSGTWTLLRNFASDGYVQISFEGDGGSPVKIGNNEYVAITAKKSTSVSADVYIIVYNLTTNQIAATLNRSTSGGCPAGRDNTPLCNGRASISKSGNYLVVADFRINKNGIYAYTFSASTNTIGSTATYLSPQEGQHNDLCLDSANNDVLVQQARNGLEIVMIRLSNAASTTVVPADKMGPGLHIACHNVQRPGWAYLSQYQRPSDEISNRAYYREIFAFKLDGACVAQPTQAACIERFAKTRSSSPDNYDRQAHAVPSPDGKRILWASDWGNSTGPVEAYIVYRPVQ